MSIFNSVKVKKAPKSKFNLSHDKKLSIRMGNLYPVLLEEIMPGDSFKVSSQVFLRFAPLIAPVMEKFYCNIHYFFVPNRLVWEDWQDFVTGGEDGLLEPAFPYMEINETNYATVYGAGLLPDYFGIPTIETAPPVGWTKQISALPFRAYNLIYNEYYRDQNLEVEYPVPLTGGADITTNARLKQRAWTKTYFHSALPWAQRGAEVTLPFDDVNYSAQSNVFDTAGAPQTGTLDAASGVFRANLNSARIENIESIGAPTINELRKAYRLQEWLENNARGGARYIEQIMSHFGVKSSDARLQRPEYLGGGKTDVVISEVLNTTGLAEVSPDDGGVQGRMAGHGVSLGSTNSFKKSFEEHGFVIGLMSVMSYPSYWQGLHRKWTRFDKLDYPFPEFANLGEQAILNQEIYLKPDIASPTTEVATWGYTPRYAEFKTGFNSISGDFRTTLDFWHYAQKYADLPPLNADFMKYSNDNRIWNVIDQDIDNIYCQIRHKISAIRPLPFYGTPRT